ncbi:MAG: glycosyltransferase family 39 protein [Bryobacterales bacterium]|nr:glycosyltransferase family 39 protein [Bryobacterales bacterium]
MKYLPALLILAGFVFFSQNGIPRGPYLYDEADYLFAASQGVGANLLDHPSQSFASFLYDGLVRGRNPAMRLALSEQVRTSNDIVFYRHWHGPLYFYWLMATSASKHDEHAMRMFSRVFPLLTFLVIYAGSLRLFPGPRGLLSAILASTLFLWSYATLRTTEIAPHLLFVLCYTAALLLLVRLLETGKRKYWYAAVCACACAFLTLEVTVILVFTLLVCAWMERRRLILDRVLVRNTLAAFLGPVLLLWPAALFKLSFVKAYLFMTYLALFRKSPWGNVGFLDTWRNRFVSSPLEWILILAAVVLYVFHRPLPGRRALSPVLLYAMLMLVLLLRVNTGTPRYMTPFLPAFHIFTGFLLAGFLSAALPPSRAFLAAAALCLLLAWNTQRQIQAHPLPRDLRTPEVLQLLGAQRPDAKPLLIPQEDIPTLHYYLPHLPVKPYLPDQFPSPELLAGGDYSALLYPGYPVRFRKLP